MLLLSATRDPVLPRQRMVIPQNLNPAKRKQKNRKRLPGEKRKRQSIEIRRAPG